MKQNQAAEIGRLVQVIDERNGDLGKKMRLRKEVKGQDNGRLHKVDVTQLRSGEDPELWNTQKNASYRGGWAANCFNYSPTKGDGGVWAIWSSPG